MSKLLTVLLILPSGAEMSSIDGDFLLDQDFHDALESVRHVLLILFHGSRHIIDSSEMDVMRELA